jgi:hypothetical protein
LVDYWRREPPTHRILAAYCGIEADTGAPVPTEEELAALVGTLKGSAPCPTIPPTP